MIWVAGEIVPDDALKISVLDRTFQHGLGLFETVRTWNGHVTLLDRHLARMRRSAEALQIPLVAARLPDATAASKLLQANRHEGDAVLRLTLSGGVTAESESNLWMSTRALPETLQKQGLRLGSLWRVSYDDPVTRHKCLNYLSRHFASQWARSRGDDEAIMCTRARKIWEGSRSNLFAVVEDMLLTPPISGPLLPGIMRAVVLERAHSLGIKTHEQEMTCDHIKQCSEAFMTNAVRGIQPIASFPHKDLGFRFFDEVPGPVTRRLLDDILPWLNRGGIDP